MDELMPEEPMERIYLGVPYSHPDPKVREFRFNQVNLLAGALIKKGYLVYSPISHSHPITVAYDLPKGYDFWQRIDREFIRWCHQFWILQMEGWDTSTGLRDEEEYSIQQNKKVVYISHDHFKELVYG